MAWSLAEPGLRRRGRPTVGQETMMVRAEDPFKTPQHRTEPFLFFSFTSLYDSYFLED
jgi:hypothetical protein